MRLANRHLLLSVNSSRQAERGRAMLEALLGDRLGAPEIVVSTLDELKARESTRRKQSPCGIRNSLRSDCLIAPIVRVAREEAKS